MSAKRGNGPASVTREQLGAMVRTVWVDTVRELIHDPKPGWLTDWSDLTDPFQREVDQRIGERLAAVCSPERMLREMHATFRLHGGWMPDQPTTDLPDGLADVRWALIDEEVTELRDAMRAGDLVKIADAIADAVTTLVGTAVIYGIPFDAVFREVHRSNMTKTNVPGQPKLVKGTGYEPPQIAEILGSAGIRATAPVLSGGIMTRRYRSAAMSGAEAEALCLTEGTDWEEIADRVGGRLVNREIGDSGDFETILIIPAGDQSPAEAGGNVRERIVSALDASIDRYARCKVCEQQVDAVAAVTVNVAAAAAEAAVRTERERIVELLEAAAEHAHDVADSATSGGMHAPLPSAEVRAATFEDAAEIVRGAG